MEKKWLLWVDFLGFKDWMLRQKDLSKSMLELEKSVAFALDLPEVNPLGNYFNSHLISDTLVISTKGNSIPELCALCAINSHLMKALLAIGLPLRGVIVYESFVSKVDTKKTILLGQGIVKAASIEPLVNFYGVFLDDSCVERFEELGDTLNAEHQFEECSALKFKLSEYFDFKEVSFKNGCHKVPVAKWLLPEIPTLLISYNRLIAERVKKKEISYIVLKSHIVKLKNSLDMFDTIGFQNDSEKNDILPLLEFHWGNLRDELSANIKLFGEFEMLEK